MNHEYENLRNKLRQFMHFLGEPGELALPVQNLEDLLLEKRLGVNWFPTSRTFPQGAYVCSEDAGHELLRLAWQEENAAAWRLARKILAHRIALREDVPEGLLTFAALYFADQISAPKPLRRDSTWSKRFLTYFLCVIAQIEFASEIEAKKLSMTKSSTSKPENEKPESVCDAVADVLSDWKITASYRSVQQIWNASAERDKQIRADMKEYVSAMLQSYESDPIAFLSSSVDWMYPEELSKPGFPFMPEEK
ncbi:hypothetical protein [uncultured Roseovarius sp.]|uniref:hypothetical protein n=1 Tax=uncultured Roseovarius sp. TaxID=293344 RepID=UPI0026251FD4|nr:hypothetical protein [uncultured Roseovarius sp.]